MAYLVVWSQSHRREDYILGASIIFVVGVAIWALWQFA